MLNVQLWYVLPFLVSGPKHFLSEFSSESFAPECFCVDDEDTLIDVGVETFADCSSASTPWDDVSDALESSSDKGVDCGGDRDAVMEVSMSGSMSGNGCMFGRRKNI